MPGYTPERCHLLRQWLYRLPCHRLACAQEYKPTTSRTASSPHLVYGLPSFHVKLGAVFSVSHAQVWLPTVVTNDCYGQRHMSCCFSTWTPIQERTSQNRSSGIVQTMVHMG